MTSVRLYKSLCRGKIKIPASKSDAHRKIIASALCFDQEVTISNVDFSKDIEMTLEAMKNFASIKVRGDVITIKSHRPTLEEASFNAFESGSTLRFLIPLFSVFFKKTTISGTSKLLSRPLDIYEDIYKEHLKIDDRIIVDQALKPGKYVLRGDISSQFISGLLFTLPLLDGDSEIEILEPFESRSYVNLTLGVLKEFGIEIQEVNNTYLIKGNQKYQAKEVKVEGDYSQLAFFGALGLINNELAVTNLNKDSLQGDKKIIDIFKALKGRVEETSEGYLFKPSYLEGTTIDLEDNPDLGPILFALAPLCAGTTIFKNVRRLRIKESDRIQAMKEELLKFGAEMEESENQVIIREQELKVPSVPLSSHNDHRILMALSILSTLVDIVDIEGVEAKNKSYPRFFDDLFSLGIRGEIYD